MPLPEMRFSDFELELAWDLKYCTDPVQPREHVALAADTATGTAAPDSSNPAASAGKERKTAT